MQAEMMQRNILWKTFRYFSELIQIKMEAKGSSNFIYVSH